ncbi:MAG: ABC transporter ATP-binding protein [Acidobacteriota bacterium]
MIRFSSLSKRYGAHSALEDVSLEVAPGEVVALLGPNGSGKTTSLKIAAGLVHPSSGEVWVGEPPRRTSEPAARAAISFLPQKVAFPESLTGREVLAFYGRLRDAPAGRAEQVLRVAALNGAGARAVGTYSGGMVQRLGLAVAALADASVLLLDEPTAALDPEGLRAFYEFAAGRRDRRGTVLFTSHQLGDVERLADRFAVLVEGRLVAELTGRELAQRLAARGSMRVATGPVTVQARERVAAAVAGAGWEGDDLLVRCSPAQRPEILALLAREGIEARTLVTEEGRLDALYQELVGGRG